MENRPKAPVPVNDLNAYPNASTSLKRSEAPKVKTKPKAEPIVDSSKVRIKKQSAWKRAKHRIFEQEGAEIKEYLSVILTQTLKNTISNIVDIVLYGDARHVGRRNDILGGGGVRYGNYVSYNSISNTRSAVNDSRYGVAPRQTARGIVPIDDFFFETYSDAFDVIYKLCTYINDYNVATVADLYGCIKDENGRPLVAPWTYNNRGWTERELGIDAHELIINGNRKTRLIRLTSNGYCLNLPDPVDLDRV